MPDTDLDILQTAIKRQWSVVPSRKAKPYVNAFFAAVRRGTTITAKVVGNHGTYTVSIQVEDQGLTSACSCYIGKYGHCHHCAALAITFLNDPTRFKVVKQKQVKQVRTLDDVRIHLQSMILDALLKEPRRLGAQHGVTARGTRSSSGGLGRRGGGAGGEKGLYFSYPSPQASRSHALWHVSSRRLSVGKWGDRIVEHMHLSCALETLGRLVVRGQ